MYIVEVEFEINTYKVHLFSRQPLSETPTVGIITLWMEDTICGYIHFYPDGIALPNPTYETKPTKYIRLRFHFSQFHAIVDMLRSEKPLYIEYSDHPPTAILRSGKEPIGEEEKLFHPKE